MLPNRSFIAFHILFQMESYHQRYRKSHFLSYRQQGVKNIWHSFRRIILYWTQIFVVGILKEERMHVLAIVVAHQQFNKAIIDMHWWAQYHGVLAVLDPSILAFIRLFHILQNIFRQHSPRLPPKKVWRIIRNELYCFLGPALRVQDHTSAGVQAHRLALAGPRARPEKIQRICQNFGVNFSLNL